MAIQISSFKDYSGVTHKNIYVKPDGIMIHRSGNSRRIELGIAAYSSEAASDSGRSPLQGSTFGVSFSESDLSDKTKKAVDALVSSLYNDMKSRKPKMKVGLDGKETSDTDNEIDLQNGKDV